VANVKYSAKTLKAVKAAWEAGVRDCVIMAKHGLPKGSLVSTVRRKGWRRPWSSLKTLPVPHQKLYKKMRREGVGRREAFAKAKALSAASPVLPTAARLGPSVEPQPALSPLPAGSPALNSEAADG